MGNKNHAKERVYLGQEYHEVMELPNLVDIQFISYEKFLQIEALQKGEPLKRQGLEDVFKAVFPIASSTGDMVLEYCGYSLGLKTIKFTEVECKRKGISYAVPIRAIINLIFQETGEIRQKEVYFGDIPLLTERGTFIINGAERVVVSQIHRSPGVIFAMERGVFTSRIIPYRGSWLEFEIDQKRELIYAKIDRKKRILGTMLLRAFGLDRREKIIEAFYQTTTLKMSEYRDNREKLVGVALAKEVVIVEDKEQRRLCQAGSKLRLPDIEDLLHFNVDEIVVIDTEHPDSLSSEIILNCFEREEVKFVSSDKSLGEPTRHDALFEVYSVVLPGESITVESAEKDLNSIFFSSRRYDLGSVGRYKLDRKFNYTSELDAEGNVLRLRDIVNTMGHLIKVFSGEENLDDIDHLGNRRIRSVGELLTNQLKTAFTRMVRIAKERMSIKETDTIRPQDLVSIKPIVAAIKEFFGSSQLSQFMDQVNPLSELTHKRRLNALGPGGLSRERAGFEVRDVHYTHYGRMCPIETPEGPNIGLIVSLANYTRVNDYGFLETPYRKIVDGKATSEIEYLSAIDEDRYFIAQANSQIDKKGSFLQEQVAVRKGGDYTTRPPGEIQFMDVSPKQVISTATSLVPFLEHDDANRALMGSNMQRQAVPLLFSEAPIVGTGMERKAAYDSGVLVKARRSGAVVDANCCEIIIKPEGASNDSDSDHYNLLKFERTNQDTCFNQKPLVKKGEKVIAGQVLADGPATDNQELALGKNVLVGFVPWNGFNFEDAILLSERIVKEDVFTSIHIKEFSVDIRETKLGPEKITRDIPNANEKSLEHLDSEGVINIGAKVKAGSVLIGKVTPKSDTETTPEFKLLNSIFGEKAKEVRDSSLRVPHGTEGTVIDVQRLKRSEGDDLSPGVDEVVKVLIATKRKLREGDKLAGRHGNKGVVAKILPVEEMPFMADGTPLDVCLSPLGVPSRMNLGQLLETELGWAGKALNNIFATPVFQSTTPETISAKLKEAGLPENSKITLYDGRTGLPFKNDIFVGYMYILKLHHLADDKMHARSTGPYSLVTQQPLGGKAQFGGQRLGEMEVWALEAYGAANTLLELLTIKSDDMAGRSKIYQSIVKGEPFSVPGIPESFNVLVQELRGLALDLAIYDSKGERLPMTERDEEIINQQGTRF